MHIGDDGWLVEDAEGLPALLRIPTARSTPWAAGLKGPLAPVWHGTAGPCTNPDTGIALANWIRTYNPLTDKGHAASWHVLVCKDGRIIQSVQTDRASWHVGKPGRIGGKPAKTGDTWDAINGWAGTLFGNINSATVGIELENSIRLEKVGDKFYCWPFWLDPDHPETGPDHKLEVPASRAVLVGSTWWDDFPQAQRDAATRLLQALAVKYGWTRDVSQYEHRMFDPARKEDAGAAWMELYLPGILDTVFGSAP
jgi:N-acetyl-anhydromuramyl-L-alanine amidase AmpD